MSDREASRRSEELHLRVFEDHSELFIVGRDPQTFSEGAPTQAAQQRYQRIGEAFDEGYLQTAIDEVRENPQLAPLDADHVTLIEELVGGVTSEKGRALVALTLTLMCVKDIQSDQSVRLHKGGGAARDFSWSEGISLRRLDTRFITPVLRENHLLSLNKDGFMMTRSLAENYPYSGVYKARLRGPREQWLAIVEALERGELDARAGLKLLIAKLLQRTAAFMAASARTLRLVQAFQGTTPLLQSVSDLIFAHIEQSTYSARLLEVAMHSAMQCLEDNDVFEGQLRPLAQMRSANKKAGNIGDVEVVLVGGPDVIVEAWDAKYGQPYLRDELEELSEKLAGHTHVERVGFVVNREPDRPHDLEERRAEIAEEFGIEVTIVSLDEWLTTQRVRSGMTPDEFASCWLVAYVESICLVRRDRAPIDEPADQWVVDLAKLME